MMSKFPVRAAGCAALGIAICVTAPLGVHWLVPGQAVSAASAPFVAAGRSAPESTVPAGPTKLLRYADISKDAVVFSYAGDLWSSPRQGGSAHPLTSGPGDKLYPKYSPDGKWIAFTASYDGNPDVYVIPSEGGEPKRLTFHPTNDNVLGWTPDGKSVLFRSDRISAPPFRTTRLFTVSVEGGMPK